MRRAVYTARHWLTGKTVRAEVAEGRITAIQETGERVEEWIAPGLIDVQVNGYLGYDFNGMDTAVDTVVSAIQALHQVGVTQVCPTIVTGSKERMLHSIRTIAEACAKHPLVRRSVIGIHVEGPFISEKDGPRGAHRREWVRDPDLEELQSWLDAAPGLIRKVTLAPEKPGAIQMIEALQRLGIVAAIGHCDASSADIERAVQAGATMSTHLGNGAHPVLKRHPNYIWDQLAEDRLWAGLIADGFHLPPATLKSMIRVKGAKAILTSDAVHLAGLPPGTYSTPLNESVVLEPNGFLHLADTKDILAGAALPLIEGIRNVVRWGICGLGEAIQMATLHPAQLFGLDAQGLGTLSVGSPAHLIIYRQHDTRVLELIQTVVGGEVVYEA